MNGFVDIHSHILPNIDGGSTSMEETFEMIELAYQEGIRTIYATPHCGGRNSKYDVNVAKEELKLISGTLEKMHPDMTIVLGGEIRYYENMVEDIKQGKWSTLGRSQCVLIEFDRDAEFETIETAVKELKAARYIPIIAHAERYTCLQEDIAGLDALHSEGAYIQVNADMLLEPPVEETANGVIGIFKFPPKMSNLQIYKNTAWQFVKAHKVDFVATDAHGSDNRHPVMKTSLQMIYKYVSPQIALELAEKAGILGR